MFSDRWIRSRKRRLSRLSRLSKMGLPVHRVESVADAAPHALCDMKSFFRSPRFYSSLPVVDFYAQFLCDFFHSGLLRIG